MDRTYVDDHHVAARYLADRLPEDERRQFEVFLQANPDFVGELEAVARLKVGLHRVAQRGEFESPAAQMPWFRNARILALAASVAVVAVGFVLWFGRDFVAPGRILVADVAELRDQNGDALSVAHTYAIMRTRGAAFDVEIELPAVDQAMGLRVLPEYEPNPARYRLTLSRLADDESLAVVTTLRNMEAAGDGFVDVFFNSSRLQAGRYRLTISGETATDAADSVSIFRIKLNAPTSVR